MPELSIRLRLRSVTAQVCCRLDLCGPDCLLQGHPDFVAALPGGMGAAAADGLSARNLLFETARGTLIKHRKHLVSNGAPGDGEFFGVPFRFDRASQDRAFEILRQLRPAWIATPGGGCDCSYEVAHHPGRIVYPPLSPHVNQLAQKYRTRRIADASEAAAFLRSGWWILKELHRLGIRHGDPSYYNFIQTQVGFTHTDFVLIDLDDLTMAPGPGDDWDFSVFFHHTFIPVAASFMTTPEMAAFARELFGRELFPVAEGPSDAYLRIGFASAISGMEATRALRTLEIGDQAARIFQQEFARARLQELEAKQAEIDLLAQTAAGRLACIHAQEAEIHALTQTLAERLASLEAVDREMRLQAEAARERLEVLQVLGRNLQELERKQRSSWWPARG